MLPAAALVAFIITAAYKNSILRDVAPNYYHVDAMWRLLIGLGCVPGVVALYFRLTIPETPRFTMDIERNVQQASADIKFILAEGKSETEDESARKAQAPKASWKDFCDHFGQWKNLKILIGTSYSWFALDVSPKVCSVATRLTYITT
jgi:PHS family inorganic phosphate transporter-like MFS transporter